MSNFVTKHLGHKIQLSSPENDAAFNVNAPARLETLDMLKGLGLDPYRRNVLESNLYKFAGSEGWYVQANLLNSRAMLREFFHPPFKWPHIIVVILFLTLHM